MLRSVRQSVCLSVPFSYSLPFARWRASPFHTQSIGDSTVGYARIQTLSARDHIFLPRDTCCSNGIFIIIIKFFNKKVVKRNFTNSKENGVQIIVNNNVYTKLLSRNVVRSDR